MLLLKVTVSGMSMFPLYELAPLVLPSDFISLFVKTAVPASESMKKYRPFPLSNDQPSFVSQKPPSALAPVHEALAIKSRRMLKILLVDLFIIFTFY